MTLDYAVHPTSGTVHLTEYGASHGPTLCGIETNTAAERSINRPRFWAIVPTGASHLTATCQRCKRKVS